jgi:hypothetical protein
MVSPRRICAASRSSAPTDTFFSLGVSQKRHRVGKRNAFFLENRYHRSYEIVERRRLALKIAALVAGGPLHRETHYFGSLVFL